MTNPDCWPRQRTLWAEHAVEFLTATAPRKTEFVRSPAGSRDRWDDRYTLDDLYRFLNESLPRDQPLLVMSTFSMRTEMFAGTPLLKLAGDKRLATKRIVEFCDRLIQAGGPANVIYGRCGKLALRVRISREPLDKPVLQEATAIMELSRA